MRECFDMGKKKKKKKVSGIELIAYVTVTLMIHDAIDPRLSVALGAVPYAPGQVMYLCADIAKLKEDTGFAPEVSFEEGIKKTIMWVKEHG